MSILSDRALERAKGQIGQKENPLGSNWGHPVQDYLASVGIGFPASWCMAFMYWCFKDAALQLGMKNPLFKTGGCLVQWNKSSSFQWDEPAVGDVFIMDHGHGLGHTGIVEKVNGDGTITTIDGNTNDNGSREGIAVERKIRKIKGDKIIGYLRF